MPVFLHAAGLTAARRRYTKTTFPNKATQWH
jgi:hypothetical protein